MKTQPIKTTWDASLLVILLTVALFFVVQMGEPHFDPPLKKDAPQFVLNTPSIEKALIYDWPQPFAEIDALTKEYGQEIWQQGFNTPKEAVQKFNQIIEMPIWQGALPLLETHLAQEAPPPVAPLFYKLRQGEVWRLVTPAFLHYDLFHLFFNLMWIAALARPFEKLFGWKQWTLFFTIAAVVTNTLQYLATGPFFMGLSGVVTTFLGFWWSFQLKTNQTLFPLPRFVLRVTIIILIGFAAISWLSFFSQYLGGRGFGPQIANTAHLSGLFLGLLLGVIWPLNRLTGENS